MSAVNTSTPGACVGVDIGGTTVQAVLLDPHGRQVQEVTLPLRSKGPEETLATALESVRRVRAADGDCPTAGVGVAVPGVVDGRTGVVRSAVNLDINGQPLALKDRMENALGVPVTVDNDTRVAALGARRHFSADLPGDGATLVYLGIGTGISAGVIQDGRLIRGRDGLAGEIGHTVAAPGGPTCACGLPGCLEVVAAGPAFAAAWPQAGHRPAQALLHAAARGVADAKAAIDRIVGYLTRAVHWLILAHAPDLLVLGGGVGSIGQLSTLIRERLGDAAMHSPLMAEILSPQRVLAAPPDVPLGALGAATLVSITSEREGMPHP